MILYALMSPSLEKHRLKLTKFLLDIYLKKYEQLL